MPARHEAPNQPFRAPVYGGPHQRVSQRQRVRDGADLKPRGEIGWEGDRPVQKRESTDVSRRGIPFYGSHRTVRYRAHRVTILRTPHGPLHHNPHCTVLRASRWARLAPQQSGFTSGRSGSSLASKRCAIPLLCNAMLIIMSTRAVLPYPPRIPR